MNRTIKDATALGFQPRIGQTLAPIEHSCFDSSPSPWAWENWGEQENVPGAPGI
jgi:hypothetical protein